MSCFVILYTEDLFWGTKEEECLGEFDTGIKARQYFGYQVIPWLHEQMRHNRWLDWRVEFFEPT